jgi:hypothetical protein
MFIKWKPGRLTKHCVHWEYSRRLAYVVESVRTPAGPRHRHVCYVASFIDLGDPKDYRDTAEGVTMETHGTYAQRCVEFWATALPALDRAGITGADRAKLEADLKRVVDRPDAAAIARARARRDKEDRERRTIRIKTSGGVVSRLMPRRRRGG